MNMALTACVVPAQAGTHTPCPRGQGLWVPAFAGTTASGEPIIRKRYDAPALSPVLSDHHRGPGPGRRGDGCDLALRRCVALRSCGGRGDRLRRDRAAAGPCAAYRATGCARSAASPAARRPGAVRTQWGVARRRGTAVSALAHRPRRARLAPRPRRAGRDAPPRRRALAGRAPAARALAPGRLADHGVGG